MDDSASTFVFPYRHIRFLEIRPEGAATAGVADGPGRSRCPGAASAPEADLEIDEDFLRRIREA